MTEKRRIAFLCFDGVHFVRHFSAAVRAALDNGFEVFAAIPSVPTTPDEVRPEVNVVRLRVGRSRHTILRFPCDLVTVCSALRKCRPDLVQALGLRATIAVACASIFVPIARTIYTITGLGLIDIDTRWSNRIIRPFVYWLLRAADRDESTCFVFENGADADRVGFPSNRPRRKVILMGTGVDTEEFASEPLPPSPPLKLAIVSRMIWSKGIDLAVEAVTRLIGRGVPVELDMYGEPDFGNQRSFSTAQLQEWGRRPGIRWHGFVTDIAGVWRAHHAGLFPTRGGEGLPRAMLEAASCGRALIAARVPGCADFVRPGVEGILVEPGSVNDLEHAIERLVREPDLLARMGHAGRQRVLKNSTREIIASHYRQLYAQMLEKR
jgi:glycosyltransferase involved in cell wall biosynthesis